MKKTLQLANSYSAGTLQSVTGAISFALTLLLLVFPSLHVSAKPLPMRFEHMMTDSKNTVAEINSIIQDHQGYIWLGGSSGLARFDAYEFKIYRHDAENPTSLSGNFIFSVYEDSDNNLWALTTLGLNLYDRDSDSFIRFLHDPGNPNSIGANSATAMIEDDEGFLWIGTQEGLDRFDRKKQTFTHYKADPNKPGTISHGYINALLRDKKGYIWISTPAGLNRLDPKAGTFEYYTHDPDNPNSISHNNVGVIIEDSSGYLWVGSRNGLNRLDPERKSIVKYFHDIDDPNSISEGRITDMILDKKGQLWIGTNENGVNIYDPKDNIFHRILRNESTVDSLISNKIRGMFEDPNGGIWISTFPSGLNYSNPQKSVFRVMRNMFFDDNSLPSDSILFFEEDQAEDLWIGTEKGLSIYNRKTETFTNYQHDPRDPESLPANAVLAIETDDADNAWIGIWSGGLSYFEKETGKLTNYIYDPIKPYDNTTITDISVWALKFDREGYLWIGGQSGALSKLNVETREFTHYVVDPVDYKAPSNPFVHSLLLDHEGVMWIGTLSGLNRYNADSDDFSRFEYTIEGQLTSGKNRVHVVFEDSKHRLWVGTESGLSEFHRESETFTFYSTSDGLRNDYITAITEDANGVLWLGTYDGMVSFNPQTRVFNNFSTLDGLAGNTSNRSSAIFASDGNIYMGTTTGISVFDPNQLITNEQTPPIRITDFKVFNKSLPGTSHIISQSSYESDKFIELDYFQNMFSVHFTALDYTQPEKSEYEYKLLGFDDNWISSGNTRIASYTNLSAGLYQFQVRGSNSDKVWSAEEANINIKILPPPWKSKSAYFTYFLLFLLLAFIAIRYQYNKIKFRKEKLSHYRYIAKIKNQFLANTSHELRTPLNGIIGLAESLAKKESVTSDVDSAHALNIIILSGRRLAKLVNDILDFSKAEENTLTVHLAPVNVLQAVKDVLDITKPLFEDKLLLVKNLIAEDSLWVHADEERLQQILLNLLGNAIKFTHRGSVEISCQTKAGFAYVSITDSGRGIPEEQIDNIFNAFEQIQDSNTRDQGGTGLGLAITRKLITLQNGKIEVESTVGKGSTFTFSLKIADPENLSASKYLLNAEKNKDNGAVFNLKPGGNSYAKHKPDSIIRAISVFSNLYSNMGEANRPDATKKEILIVDDEPINRMVLDDIISAENYNITETTNGIESLMLFENGHEFDLVLLDVMMPSISGYDVCKKIRETIPINILPIVFLSANHNPSGSIEALISGGNDFLSKPIVEDDLLTCIEFLMTTSEENKLINSGVIPGTESIYLSKFEAASGIAGQLNKFSSADIDIYLWVRDNITDSFRPVFGDDDFTEEKNDLALGLYEGDLKKITENLPKEKSQIIDKQIIYSIKKLKNLTSRYKQIAAISIEEEKISDGFFLICSTEKQNKELQKTMEIVDAAAKYVKFAIDKHRNINYLRNQDLSKK